MSRLADQLFRIIFEHWNWAPYGRTQCKFCGHSQGSPAHEAHWEHCPRLVWATVNKDSPKDRAERNTGQEYPDWETPLRGLRYYKGPYLYNEGPELLKLLAQHAPDVYQQHLDIYLRLRANRQANLSNDVDS